ncbi:MAG: DUF5814 domain-containing protein [Candidatus Odinarchaeum yellowstonii]|uniref:DUF5814 domain-containing protein n=1 Tax=Odinarchaeota yellowstonii (strain LCB_4) TaxID=1841599 RepID=A0AAF0D1R8_ODILC|nr:MAG: DUF5814 domain-containing protein [Candidatus Odinarchaeum yellowstonii]
MEILFQKYSVILQNYKNEKNVCLIHFIPGHLRLDRLTAVYSGRAYFSLENGSLRPFKFYIDINRRPVNFPGKDLITALRECKQIILPLNSSPPFKDALKSMISDFHINPDKIAEPELCVFCSVEGKFTELDGKRYKLDDKEICFSCARKEILRELSFKNVKESNKIAKYLEKLLLKTRDVRRTLNFLLYDNAVFNPDLTIYDFIPAESGVEEIKVEELNIPELLKRSLFNRGIFNLLPSQSLAVRNGLLNGESMLIVSATSGGKTLAGELAGVKKVLEGEGSLLFLVPLVALANQLYTDFKKRYEPIGLKVAIKVGMSRIDVGEEELVIVDDDIRNADIIVATYEGFDTVLRSNLESCPRKVGVIVVDEIQMLGDEDRGYELEGLIGRLKLLYPESQRLYLSATVGNPSELAERLGVKLVISHGRPIPLERHIVLAMSEADKLRLISKFIRRESSYTSSTGFKGQTIVFTNSRRKTEEIADYLNRLNIKAVAYHAGMTYAKRKTIEEAYISGVYNAVITTFALGAGFDAPCSQVIFESLLMGNDYLTVSMFNQMLGRAGRLGRHDRGKVVLLVELGRKALGFHDKTEDEVAVNLLEGVIESVNVQTDFDRCAEQVLAAVSVYNQVNLSVLEDFSKIVKSFSNNVDSTLSYLEKEGYLTREVDLVKITNMGKSVSTSFLTLKDAKHVIENINRKHYLDLAIELEPFESAYLSNRAVAELNRVFHTFFPTRFFSGSLLGSIGEDNVKLHSKLPEWLTVLFAKWVKEIFNCKCKENPLCECGKITLSKKILELRSLGLNPRNIANYLAEEYDIYAYPGDVFDWLETFLHNLTAVKRIAETLNMNTLVEEIDKTSLRIQSPL